MAKVKPHNWTKKARERLHLTDEFLEYLNTAPPRKLNWRPSSSGSHISVSPEDRSDESFVIANLEIDISLFAEVLSDVLTGYYYVSEHGVFMMTPATWRPITPTRKFMPSDLAREPDKLTRAAILLEQLDPDSDLEAFQYAIREYAELYWTESMSEAFEQFKAEALEYAIRAVVRQGGGTGVSGTPAEDIGAIDKIGAEARKRRVGARRPGWSQSATPRFDETAKTEYVSRVKQRWGIAKELSRAFGQRKLWDKIRRNPQAFLVLSDFSEGIALSVLQDVLNGIESTTQRNITTRAHDDTTRPVGFACALAARELNLLQEDGRPYLTTSLVRMFRDAGGRVRQKSAPR